MADSVADRYRKAERQRLGGIPGLSKVLADPQQGSSPILGPQAARAMADMPNYAPKGGTASNMPMYGSGQSTAGIPNPALPAFGMPGGSSQYLPPMNLPTPPTPAYQAPFSGLHNEPYGANGLPPFEQPGGSLPMQNYMPQAMTEPHGVAGTPPPPAPMPQMTAPPAMQPAAMPASIEPVPQNVGGAGAIDRLAQALARKQMAPWAVNEGNFMDQYGG